MSRMVLSMVVLSLLTACGAPPTRSMDEPASAPVSFASVVAPSGGEAAGGVGSRGVVGARAELVLIRTASMSVSVDRYQVLRDELGQWLTHNDGHVADETVGPARADLRLRVPASEFEALLAWLQGEFEVEQLQVSAADVTTEWVDLEARVRAYRTAEERLLSLVENRTATLADVLAAESELSRVRGEIESLEGRRRVLADQVALASVSLHVNVRSPPVAAVADPLGSRVGRAFSGSVGLMGAVARGAVVACAALAPWALVLAAVAVVAASGMRHLVRRAALRH